MLTTACRAGDGTRTRDHKLGRLVLYQLSYSRILQQPKLRYRVPELPTKNPSLSITWWGKDSNLRRHKPADLQSAPVGRLGTPPSFPESRLEPGAIRAPESNWQS